MKRILITVLIFLLYLALVIGAGFALHFTGGKLVIFCVVLGLLGALTAAFVLWYLHKLDPPSEGDDSNSPDVLNLKTLLASADERIRQARRTGIKSMASLPLVYVIGDENSAKTQTVLQSGLDAELIAGNIYQDGVVAPTQLANIWLTSHCALVEAGGTLLRQPGLWRRVVRATIPARLGSALSKDSRLPARAVVVCVSIERILAPNTSEQIRALAQMLNERLRMLSQTLGISLPVYVLFTKLDTIAPFADYMGRLSEEEIRLPIGALLSALDPGSGLFIEQATAQIGAHFDQLLYALSEFRLDILSRGGELPELARAYEFPRDLRKIRSGIVSFLAELARPSQIGVNPFLRGFFFTGMRAHLIEDILDVGPAQAQQQAPAASGATRIFSLGAAQVQPQQPVRRSSIRKVPQWVFLPHLFSKILLADKSALEASRASTRTSYLKRALLATAGSLVLLLFVLVTVSFFKNRALEQRVAEAAALPVSSVAPGSYASIGDLQSLERMRAVLDELNQYRTDGAPMLGRMGLFKGKALFPVACQAYSNKFRTLLLTPTQANILVKLRAVPAVPTSESDYSATYRPLKAYIISTSSPNPDSPQETVEFLPAVLSSEWQGSGSPASDQAALAQAQFAFYASLLNDPSGCMARTVVAPDRDTIQHARAYLNGFQGFEHVYQSMLSAANRRVPGVNFNQKFPGSASYIVDAYTVAGAFTKDGFKFMQDAILHPDPYFRGEEWVLGPSSGPPIDRAALSSQLKSIYYADFTQNWRSYLAKAQFVGYRNFADAGMKLNQLDSNTSAMLELFSLVSANTAVPAPEIANIFQAPQSIVPPSSADNRFIAQGNQAYIQGLQGLEGAIKALTANPTAANDPAAAAPILQAAVGAEQAAETMRNGFVPDPSGNVDKVSFTLLEAPIESAKALASAAPAGAAGGGAKNFCAAAGPLFSKFPFNPGASVDASPEEVAQVFAPGQGTFSQFTNSLHALVILQGNQYVPAPGSAIKITPAFLAFLNKAQKIQSTLYASGTGQATLDFSLTEVKGPGVSDAQLSIDGRQINGGGQSASFHWVSQPASRITLSTQKNTAPPMSGPWSVFHFGYAAPQVSPNRLKFFFSFNNQSPEVVLFDASGSGAALLNPEFMKTFHCVTNVAH